nr:hypothetical protein CR513_21790 [Ipomoea trifida]
MIRPFHPRKPHEPIIPIALQIFSPHTPSTIIPLIPIFLRFRFKPCQTTANRVQIVLLTGLSSFQIKNWGDPLGSIPHENFPGRGSSLPIQDLIKFRFPVFLFTFSLIPGINASLSPSKLSQTTLSPCFTIRSPESSNRATDEFPANPPPEIFVDHIVFVFPLPPKSTKFPSSPSLRRASESWGKGESLLATQITVLLSVLYHIPRKEEEEFPGRKNPNAKFPPVETNVRFGVTDSPRLRLSVPTPKLQKKHRNAKRTHEMQQTHPISPAITDNFLQI